jgi:hypothetical protein
MNSGCFATQALGPLLTAMALVLAGCGGQQTAEQALAKSLREAGMQKEQVFPLAGHVSVDGVPPAYDVRYSVIIVLIERGQTAEAAEPPRFVECGPDGQFCISTYNRDDGVRPGRYVIAITKLRRAGPHRYTGPDQFHNRYNDPDKNAQDPTFQIEHNAPGKSDYEFHLAVTGAEPTEVPGSHAITQIP